jgi:hypothetical protein
VGAVSAKARVPNARTKRAASTAVRIILLDMLLDMFVPPKSFF